MYSIIESRTNDIYRKVHLIACEARNSFCYKDSVNCGAVKSNSCLIMQHMNQSLVYVGIPVIAAAKASDISSSHVKAKVCEGFCTFFRLSTACIKHINKLVSSQQQLMPHYYGKINDEKHTYLATCSHDNG